MKIMYYLLLGGVIIGESCSAIQERLAIKECKFKLLSVKPYDFTFSELDLDFDIKVDNPNKVDAVLDRLEYTFFVNQTDVFTGVTGKGVRIKAGGTENFITTITLEYTKIGETIVEVLRLKKADYKIKARAFIDTVLGEISFPVELVLKK